MGVEHPDFGILVQGLWACGVDLMCAGWFRDYRVRISRGVQDSEASV